MRLVTLNYNGGDLTIDCVARLRATQWPRDRLRVVLIDNASTDGVADTVAAQWPDVEVIRSATNLGFAGGMNLGLASLEQVEHVALVNNDVLVTPGWLAPLAAALDGDPGIGAASPKILFSTRFVEIELESPTSRRGRGDRRDLGIRVSGARVDGRDVMEHTQLVDGFWGPEPSPDPDPRAPAQWTRRRALLRVPVERGTAATSIELRLHGDSPRRATARAGEATVSLDVGASPAWHPVPASDPAVEVLNSAGVMVTADGFGADRGYLEVDTGQFDEPTDVFGWSGATVLLAARYLADVGMFDERLFLYYEDFELSWRGHQRGWRTRYVPESVVRHIHSATIGEHSAMARYQNERNRLLVLARHGSPGTAARAAGRSLLVTASYARRDVVSRMLRGQRPRATIVEDRVRAFGGYVGGLPSMLRSRRRDRR